MEAFDRLVAIENRSIDRLGHNAPVVGHDFVGLFNIFILTDEPKASFAKAQQLVSAQGMYNTCDRRIGNSMARSYRHLTTELKVP